VCAEVYEGRLIGKRCANAVGASAFLLGHRAGPSQSLEAAEVGRGDACVSGADPRGQSGDPCAGQVAPCLAGTPGAPARFDKPALSQRQFADLFMQWHQFKSRITHFLADHEAMLCPSCAIAAPTHDTDMKSLEATMLSYTAPFGITGWPVAVVRVGMSEEGLPIGVQIVGKSFQEPVELAVARFPERESGGFVAPAI
jgi:Amidase